MKLVVNGADVEVDDRHAKTPLLWVLRDALGLRGTKFGCGAGFCAACTVLIDGRNTKACQTATERAVGKSVITVEGASGPVADAVRSAWHRGNVVQCGYCQPGQTLAAVSLLESDPSPDDAKIDEWMSGNLCRCGTYPRIRAAIHEAAGTLVTGRAPDPLTAPAEPEVDRLTPEQMSDPVHPYIRVRQDGTVVVFCSQIEMGQGAHTGLATLVAEELDADFDSIRVVNAANGTGPNGSRFPENVSPKDPADYMLIGRAGLLRVDAAAKILGRTEFTLDVSVPGMVTAVVLHPPRFGTTVASVGRRGRLARARGVIAVVPIDEGVAAVGETFADAQRALRALSVEWDDTHAERRSSDQLLDEHLRLLESGARHDRLRRNAGELMVRRAGERRRARARRPRRPRRRAS